MLLRILKYTLSVVCLAVCLTATWINIIHSKEIGKETKWKLVNQTFADAIAKQNKFNFNDVLQQESNSLEGLGLTKLRSKTKIHKSGPKKSILLPRLRRKVLPSEKEKKLNKLVEFDRYKNVNKTQFDRGIWRLEIGNEDRGVFVDLWEPVFDPIFGGSPTDGGMSWGVHISYTPFAKNPEWFQWIRPYLPWIDNNAIAQTSYSFEQSANMHSHLTRKNRNLPEDLWTSDQRPDVGYLAGNARIGLKNIISSYQQRVEIIDFSVGIVGPYSGAQAVHQVVHDWTGGSTDKWHQVNSEPFINLNYEYGHRFFLWEPKGRETIEIHPHTGFALGTAMTNVKAGLNIRIGRLLEHDMGAPRLAQMLTGTNFPNIPHQKLSWNFFTGIEGRAHAYSVFLDENILSRGQSVDTHPFTYDVQAGFEFGYGNYRLSFMNVYRSREFKGQQYSNEFIRVSLAAEI